MTTAAPPPVFVTRARSSVSCSERGTLDCERTHFLPLQTLPPSHATSTRRVIIMTIRIYNIIRFSNFYPNRRPVFLFPAFPIPPSVLLYRSTTTRILLLLRVRIIGVRNIINGRIGGGFVKRRV